MKNAIASCPAPEQLEQFLEELLNDSDQLAISAHVGGCRTCQAALERLTEEDPATLAPLSDRRAAGAASTRLPAGSPDTDFLIKLQSASPFARSAARVEDRGAGAGRGGELPTVPGYEILAELGRGGMGVVYQARQVSLNRMVALKMIRAGDLAGVKDLDRFRQEAEAVAQLHHPNIVQIYDIGEEQGRPYLALEFIEGGSLVSRLRGDPQPLDPAVRLIETLCEAVHFAHQQQIVHRDLKPANILLAACGLAPDAKPQTAELLPKVTDFGLAKRLDEQSMGTQTGEVVGTPSYMAPEQAAGKARLIGPATDVYALGAILYEMLTGRPPFKGATPLNTLVQVVHEEPVKPGRLRPDLPRDLETICLKCLQKEPGRRYGSAKNLADDLNRFRHGRPIMARPVRLYERAWKVARRRPLTAALLVGLVVITLLGFAGVTWQWQNAEAARADAEHARLLAGQDRERARSALYYSLIAQGQLHWRVTDLQSAEQSLLQCVPAEGQEDRRGWEWYYLKGLFHNDLFTLGSAQPGPGGGVVFHPEGRWIASVVGGHPQQEQGRAVEMRIWDATTGERVQATPCPPTVHRLAVRPDGSRLALGGTDGTVMVWDAVKGVELLRCPHHTSAVTWLAYSPDGQRIASASWDQTVKVWDSTTGQVVHVLRGHGQQVQSVAFDPSGARLASGGWDATVKIWDARQGQEVQTLRGHKTAVYSVAFSPDGQFLVSAGSNGNIKIWEVASWRVVQSLTGQAGSVLSVAFSPDGRYLAYSGSDSTVRVWDIESGVERMVFRGHTAAVEAVSFSPDGQRLASVSPGQGAVKVWDLTRHPEYATFARVGPGPDIEALAYRDDGKRLVSVTVGGQLQTWEGETGVLQEERALPMSNALVSPGMLASFAPGAERLAGRAREDARLVKVWDVKTGAEVRAFRGHTLPVSCVSFSPDGLHLASCGCDPNRANAVHEIRLWEAATGKALASLSGRGRVFAAAFSPDGNLLALGEEGGKLSLIDCSARRRILHFAGHAGSVGGVAFSPDGKLLASTGQGDGTLKVWRLETLLTASAEHRREIHTLAAPSFLYDLAFSPDGRRLAGVSRDVVKLWDVETGQEVLTLRGAPRRHWDPPFNPRVLFSPDGSRLVGTNWDESISIWDADTHIDEDQVARQQAARRQAADKRALFWHLQEAEQCLDHNNASAARFHFQRVAEAPVPRAFQVRRQRLAAQLKGFPPTQ